MAHARPDGRAAYNASTVSPSTSRILVVDDDPVVLEHAALCLHADGHDVVTAMHGEEGLQLALAGSFDLVFLDVHLPGLDGFAIADGLRAKKGPSAPPVVFMSGIEDRLNYRRAFALRAADFLIKPVGCHDLRRSVAEHPRRVPLPRQPQAAQVPGFCIERSLGSGSTASVVLATRLATGEACALKMILLPEDAEDQAQTIRRFDREFAILEALDHPGIARVLEHGVADDALYIAMEYFSGGDLGSVLRAGLPYDRAIDAAGQVARALGYLHANSVIHRDLKPSNIMLRPDGSLALVDFGIARRESLHRTAHGQICGTPTYMSPESALGRTDARSDIYSLGCVFFEMLTGRRAFAADTLPQLLEAHRGGARPRLSDDLAHWQGVMERMIALDPGDRYRDGEEAARAIEAAARGDLSAARPSAGQAGSR